jgi:alpha-1,6-mannosyltransferase
VKICALTQSYAATGGGVRTMLHAAQDWVRGRPDLEHVLIVPGAQDTVKRSGNIVTHTIASRFVPGSSAYRLLLRSDKVLRILAAERPDVVEVHCAYNLPWTALLHRRRHGGIVSGLYMTDLPGTYVEAPLRTRAGPRIAAVARRAAERYVAALYDRCDVAIGISPVIAERLRGLGVGVVHCVPLGVDLDTFQPRRRDATLRRELGAGDDDLLLVYAGRLDGEKRPDLVLDAFALLPERLNARLAIIGDGPLRETLERRAAALGGARVLPFEQDRTALARLLASADVYVSAMAHETFGLSVVEAQACGLPVVGVRAGAMVDRVRDAPPRDGFLVTPGSPAALAEPILNTPRDEWRSMGRRARVRVEAEFSWSRTFETLSDIYRRSLQARNHRSSLLTHHR